MAKLARCSECGESLKDRQAGAKTCSVNCRGKRSRRLKRQIREAGHASARNPGIREISDIVAHDTPEIAHEVIQQELRPVVRDAITEDVLRAIADMVALTPRAVQCIKEDLHSTDSTIRQRAYTLLTKYTIGHQALVRPEEPSQAGLTVNFSLPRPGHDVEGTASVIPLDEPDLRTCDVCGKDKPITEFIANSQRCATCYDEQRAYAASIL